MKRAYILLAFFICWGVVIAASSLYLICNKKDELNRLERKISSRKFILYPTRAVIFDRNGEKIAWTEWEFYIRYSYRNRKNTEKLFRTLGIKTEPVFIERTKTFIQNIPNDKVVDAVKLARKYRIRVRRRIVRRTVPLSNAAKSYIGQTLLYHGISGVELKYNSGLQGRAGIYFAVQGMAGRIAEKSFKVMLPMQEGNAVTLPYSLFEIQCGLMLTGGL